MEQESEASHYTFHTFVSNVQGGINASSFGIQAHATFEQKSSYTRNMSLGKKKKVKDSAMRLTKLLTDKDKVIKMTPKHSRRRAELMNLLKEEEMDENMPINMHELVVRLQFIIMNYGGGFIAYIMCHTGQDIFINAIIGGVADALAQATFGIVAKKYGLLKCYRLFLTIALASLSILQFY